MRFAPSPTGYLHVGGARTALFNWLFARRHGGTFILRVEDTDAERSSDDMVAGILEVDAMARARLGRGPGNWRSARAVFSDATVRSASRDRARAACGGARLRVLLLSGAAQAEAGGCRTGWRRLEVRPDLPSLSGRKEGESGSGRRTAGHSIQGAWRAHEYTDRVRGDIEFDHEQIEDFVILRSNRLPTYHLSVVADDLDMGITQVIRGDDHISNTPKHILLWRALGQSPPEFAHIPLILGTDKEAPQQAAWRDIGDGVRTARLPAGGDGELPRVARLVPRRRSRGHVARLS